MRYKDLLAVSVIIVMSIFCFLNVTNVWLIISYVGIDSAIYHSLMFTMVFYVSSLLFLIGLVCFKMRRVKVSSD